VAGGIRRAADFAAVGFVGFATGRAAVGRAADDFAVGASGVAPAAKLVAVPRALLLPFAIRRAPAVRCGPFAVGA